MRLQSIAVPRRTPRFGIIMIDERLARKVVLVRQVVGVRAGPPAGHLGHETTRLSRTQKNESCFVSN